MPVSNEDSAFDASELLNPRDTRASKASPILEEDLVETILVPSPMLSPTTLSFSSTTIRWAILLPTPGQDVRAVESLLPMRRINLSGIYVDSIENANFGPTPFTVHNSLNRSRSSSVEKPSNSTAFSFTEKTV